jgi:hypothetical protein
MKKWKSIYNDIKLPIEEMSSFGLAAFDGEIVSKNGDMLIKSSEQLFNCDNNGKLVKKFQWNEEYPHFSEHWFKERHVIFFPMQGD